MTRRTPALVPLAAAAALALAGCAHQTGTGAATAQRNPATAGLAADSAEPSPDSTDTQPTTSGTHTGRPTPSPSKVTGTGPQIVSFTARDAVCPVYAKPGAPYSKPGQVTVSWKVSGGNGVDLSMDGGLWRSYPGQQGSDTLPFECPDTTKPNTHTYTLTIKPAGVTKSTSATARPNP